MYILLNTVASGIREIMSRCVELERENPTKKYIHLEVGQPNFKTPTHIIDATINALKNGTYKDILIYNACMYCLYD